MLNISSLSLGSKFIYPQQEELNLQDASIENIVQERVKHFLIHADKTTLRKGNLYEMVQHEMEKGLLDAVLRYTGWNESRASRLLGISRGMLRQRRALFGHYAEQNHHEEVDKA